MHFVPTPPHAGTTLPALLNRIHDQSLRHLKASRHRALIEDWISAVAKDDPEAFTFTPIDTVLTATTSVILSEVRVECRACSDSADGIAIELNAAGVVLPLYSLQNVLRNLLRQKFAREGTVAAKKDEQRWNEAFAALEKMARQKIQSLRDSQA